MTEQTTAPDSTPPDVEPETETIGPDRIQARAPEPVEKKVPPRVGPEKIKTSITKPTEETP